MFVLPTAADELLATPVSDRREAAAAAAATLSGEGKTLEMLTAVAEAEEDAPGAVEPTLLLALLLPPLPADEEADDEGCCCCCCC